MCICLPEVIKEIMYRDIEYVFFYYDKYNLTFKYVLYDVYEIHSLFRTFWSPNIEMNKLISFI